MGNFPESLSHGILVLIGIVSVGRLAVHGAKEARNFSAAEGSATVFTNIYELTYLRKLVN